MRRIVVTVAVMFVVPLVANAQMTWLAFSKLAPGKSGAEGMGLVLQEKDVMDGLLEDGVIRGWGIAVPANHRPGDTANFLEWVSIEDWAKVDQWVGRVMANQQAMEPDEAAEMMRQFQETFEPGSHYDEVVRNAVMSEIDPDSFEKIGVFYVSTYTAKEGHGDAFLELAKNEAVPVAEKLVADGAAIGYGMHVPEIHGVGGWTHRFWWALPNLEGIGTLKAAYAEAAADTLTSIEDMTVPGTHYDTIYISMFVDMASSD